MARSSKRDAAWQVVASGVHLQLSAIAPPDARVPGPVIGPGSRVRPCEGIVPASELAVICLEVAIDDRIERGYTIRRMVPLSRDAPASLRLRLAAAAVIVSIAVLVAIVLDVF